MKWIFIFFLPLCSSCETTNLQAINSSSEYTEKSIQVIAHRGASGELPENTIEAFKLAVDQGADYIEFDLVMTKDGQLVVSHEKFLSKTTDIKTRPRYAKRKKIRRSIIGLPKSDWWIEDFTTDEIKTLRTKQSFDGRTKQFDGLYEIPTLAEVLDFASKNGVGLYIELKSPSYYSSVGLDMVESLLDAIEGHKTPILIQSFEAGTLRQLNEQSDWPLLQLYSKYAVNKWIGREPSLASAAEYADAVGPIREAMKPSPSAYIGKAHKLGLKVYPYNFRSDEVRRGFSNLESELQHYFVAGVDGVFTDFPKRAVASRDDYLRQYASSEPE